MSLFVYVTEECKKDAKTHGKIQWLEKVKNELERNQYITWDRFPRNFFKKRDGNLRLIAREFKVEIGGELHMAIVFFRILTRGGSDYTNFMHHPENFFEEKLKPLIDLDELKTFVEEELSKNIVFKPELSEDEQRFLSIIEPNREEEFFVFESRLWVEKIVNKEYIGWLAKIYEKLIELDKPLFDDEYAVELGGIVLFFKKFGDRLLFLYDFEKKDKITGDFVNSTKTKLSQFTIDDAKKQSFRSYPFLMLFDYGKWEDIEKDKSANLSLSPEEEDVLFSAFTGFSQEGGFPIFINGRAGSGKSTILQYVFAHYLNHFKGFKDVFQATPLFLTYSETLSNSAKENVNSILNASYRFYQDSELAANKSDKTEKMDGVKGAISFVSSSVTTFQNVLFEYLNDSQREKFSKEKYIDFKLFKDMWQKKYERLPNLPVYFTPEISWHILRTYIKGYSIDGFLEKDEYVQLPKKERTVNKVAFDDVYDRVWENWYKSLKNEGYWDDQDLVRYVLDNVEDLAKYPGVFCDEAQDFTRIELEFLYRINYFSSKKVGRDLIKKVPFAFAGDPFQTLNPTGFRWEAIKAAYTEKFLYTLSPEERWGNLELNYKELSFNYRSSSEIVNISNAVQLLRKVVFNYKDIEPQESWDVGRDSIPVYRFNIRKQEVIEELKKQQDLHLIIPDESSNREYEFVLGDNDLKNIVDFDEESRLAERVSSSMRAKGLEFERVAVIKFGDYISDFFNLENRTIDEYRDLSAEEKIALEYFFNRLYVAVTRPKRMLYIVDTDKGYKALWKFATRDFLEHLLTLIDDENKWRLNADNPNIAMTVEGEAHYLNEGSGDPLDLAVDYKNKGLNLRDSYWMKQAAAKFKRLKRDNDYYECMAVAYKFDRKWEESVENYILCNKIKDALEMLWREKQYNLIKKYENDFMPVSEGLNELRIKISKLIVFKCGILGFNNFLEKLIEHKELLRDQGVLELWSHALNTLMENVSVKTVATDESLRTISLLNTINKWGFIKLDKEIAGKLLYRLKQYENALTYFKECNYSGEERNECEIQVLMKKFSLTPDDLSEEEFSKLKIKFQQLKDWERLYSVYERSSNFKNLSNVLKVLKESPRDNTHYETFYKLFVVKSEVNNNFKPLIMFLTNIGKIDEALKYLEKVGNPNLFKDVLLKLWDKKFKNFNLSAVAKAKKKEIMSDFILAYLRVLIENNRYRTLEAILKNDIEGNEDVVLILELSKQIGVNIIGLLTKALINAQIDWERIPGEFQRTFREKYENSKIEESLSFEESCLLKERTMRFDDVISFYEKKYHWKQK